MHTPNGDRVLVWVQAWQLQCCGAPFAVGEEVTWTLDDPDVDWLEAALGVELAGRIAAAEEHHGQLPDDAPTTTGTVVGIRTAHGRYAPTSPDARTSYPVVGSAMLASVDRVDGSEPETDDLRLNGYVVELSVRGG